nr:MAG TPA: Single-strand binding protein-strand binding protein, DNA BINDING.8A [Caudoviricetes sp.]
MASYSGNIDLLSLSGAQVYKGIDAKNPERAFVCIPIAANEIKVEAAANNPQRMLAKMRVNIWPLNEQYKNRVRQSAQERGNTNVNVPTHEMQLSFSTEHIKTVVKMFPKLVEQVKEANKERDPEIVNQDPTDENTHLFKAIRQRMNKRLAMLYQPQPTQPSTYQQPTYAQAGAATGYVAPAQGAEPDFAGYNPEDDDLPF